LRLTQNKTGEEMLLHVSASLARVLETMKGRHAERLFLTPAARPGRPLMPKKPWRGSCESCSCRATPCMD
jgi:hypothetical protein